VLSSSACLRAGFTVDGAAGHDRATDSAAGHDRATADSRLDRALADGTPGDLVSPPFGAAQPIAALLTPATASDYDPFLTEDQLELYFTSDGRPGKAGENLWWCQRASVGSPWGSCAELALSSSSRDISPAISPDGLTLVFASQRAGATSWDLWISTRPARSGSWSTPQALSDLNSGMDEVPATVSNDGQLILFNRGADATTDLCLGRRTAGVWVVETLDVLNSTSFDSHPALAADRRHLAFDSDRPGGKGLRDLYLSAVTEVLDGLVFSAPTPIVELNTATNDTDPWLSSDLRTIVFARSPAGASDIWQGPLKLYEAHR